MRGILCLIFCVGLATPVLGVEYIVGFLDLKKSDNELQFRMRSGGAQQIHKYEKASGTVPCVSFINKYGHEDASCSIRFDKSGLITSKIDENFPNEEGFVDAGWGSAGIDGETMTIRFRADSAKTLMAFLDKDSKTVTCTTSWGTRRFKGAGLFKVHVCKMHFGKD